MRPLPLAVLSKSRVVLSKSRDGTFQKIAQLIEPTLQDLGFELVQARLMGGSRKTLQIMAEPLDRTRTMTVEDCAEISHAVSALLDVEDPITGAYDLEVSSPGLDRPLVRRADYERFAGLEARIELALTSPGVTSAGTSPSPGTSPRKSAGTSDGRRRFTGRLKGVSDEAEVLIEVGGEVVRLPLADIRKAKLVLNDELLHRARQAQG